MKLLDPGLRIPPSQRQLHMALRMGTWVFAKLRTFLDSPATWGVGWVQVNCLAALAVHAGLFLNVPVSRNSSFSCLKLISYVDLSFRRGNVPTTCSRIPVLLNV